MFNVFKYFISKALKKSRLESIYHSYVHPSSSIQSGTSFYFSRMDRFSFCGYDCDIYNAEIGSFTSIASLVVIGGARHPMEWGGMSPVFYAGRDSLRTKFSKHSLDMPPRSIIGSDVWIGRSAIVMSGVRVGNGAVVGAGSVVTKDVPPYAIVAGNPAKLIRYRFDEKMISDFVDVSWWTLNLHDLKIVSKYIEDPSLFISAIRNLKK